MTTHIDVPEDLAAPVSVAAYFVVAEALANVAKYAEASAVELSAESDAGQLRRAAISPTGRSAAARRDRALR